MAFTGSFVCNNFKVDLLAGRTNFTTTTGNSYKCALYTSSATLTAATTAYTVTGEHAATGTYTANGKVLVNAAGMPVLSAAVGVADFDDLTWAASTITARGALIYNDTVATPVADPAVVVLDFLSDKISSAGDFTIVFPVADSTNAIIRIA